MSDTKASFVGHPMLQNSAPQQINIDCTVSVWDTKDLIYWLLNDYSTSSPVGVTITEVGTQSSHAFLTNTGKINGNFAGSSASLYSIKFHLKGLKFGYRTYPSDVTILRKPYLFGSSWRILPPTLILPEAIYPFYTAFNVAQGALAEADHILRKAAAIKAFEDGYKPGAVNILSEGDSWFDYPISSSDLFRSVRGLLTSGSTRTPRPVAFLPLQRWAHTSMAMFELDTKAESQRSYLMEYLSRYRFDLMLLSCGGNDFALSLEDYINKSLDPVAIINTASAIASASSLSIDFTKSGSLEDIATHVLGAVGNRFAAIRFPETPPAPASPYEDIVRLVLNDRTIDDMFILIRFRLSNLCSALDPLPIIAHTYSYPIYREHGSYFPGTAVTLDGPYFRPALQAAGVFNKVLQTLCIKALIDAFTVHVLEEVRTAHANFHYADLRPYALAQDRWLDEMHLSPHGAGVAAWPLYNLIKSVCPGIFL